MPPVPHTYIDTSTPLQDMRLGHPAQRNTAHTASPSLMRLGRPSKRNRHTCHAAFRPSAIMIPRNIHMLPIDTRAEQQPKHPYTFANNTEDCDSLYSLQPILQQTFHQPLHLRKSHHFIPAIHLAKLTSCARNFSLSWGPTTYVFSTIFDAAQARVRPSHWRKTHVS